ncbi:NAD(P)H-flavin reductase [Thorsellia kenyensis]|uniref:NAD(P)H-flavin reductase n=1 Tax=Thorsellia kenyensis TaxID=1549888 RepID=A0ABV6CBY6_9GAMM
MQINLPEIFETKGKIESIEQLLPTIFKIKMIINTVVPFLAGQYLNVIMGAEDKRPFSIASVQSESAKGTTLIELHIGGTELNEYSFQVIQKATEQGYLDIELPKGDCYLRKESVRPLLLIAGGTGYSYIRPLLIEALANPVGENTIRPIYFYWGVNRVSFLYDLDSIRALEDNFDELFFNPVVVSPNHGWQGKTGMVLDVIEKDFADLSEFDVYLAGPIAMAKEARDRLIKNRNVSMSNLFSDTYSYI